MVSENYGGSIWLKWDLHIHSNASDGKQTPKQIIDEAVNKGIAAIALTDHHTVRNINEIKEYGKNRGIFVISGIEFRTEYGAKSVHMIGLFPDEFNGIPLNQKALEELILSPLGLSNVAIVAKGKEDNNLLNDEEAFKKGMFNVQVDFKSAANLIHKYGGLVSVHAGSKANSIEEMKHDGSGTSNVKDVVESLGTVKEELMEKYIDICEIGSTADKNEQFYISEYSKPVIVASDAHSCEKVGKLFTWIKADRSFDGLRQILYEPESRVRIQENRPEMKNGYQVIDRVKFDHGDFGTQEIPFNSGLNTIIGGRSSGKSILLGCIAKLADYAGNIKKDNDDYEKYIVNVTKTMSIVWSDGSEERGRKVEYFPQSFINNLAAKTEETSNLIESILKGDDKRRNIYADFEQKISDNNTEIAGALERYFNLLKSRQEIQDQLLTIGDSNGIEREIVKIQELIDDEKKLLLSKLSEDEDKYYKILKEKLKNYENNKALSNVAILRLRELGNLQVLKDISTNMIDLPQSVSTKISLSYESLKHETELKWQEIINENIDMTSKQIQDDEMHIKEIETNSAFKHGEVFYKENAVIEELSKRLDIEKKKSDEIKGKIAKCKYFDEELEKIRTAILDKQFFFYQIMSNVSNQVSMEKDEVSIIPKPQFDNDKFISFIENNFNKRGQKVQALIDYSWEDEGKFHEMLDSLYNCVLNNEYTLKAGREKKQVITELVSTNYYRLVYDVKYQGDNLSSMSEGKKAFVILRLILDFDENECPILIDQPEDDLDNRAIYNDLVSYIRSKKKQRQMILVTHNPNIVVAADSEEIVVANQNGVHSENQDNLKFEYRTGSLENTSKKDNTKTILLSQGIRQHVCDLLEGGDDAFKKREDKYGFSMYR